MPVAKSKQFWVPKRVNCPKEEYEEVKHLYNKYRTEMKSIREHLRKENLRTSATSSLASRQAAEEEEEHHKLMKFNQDENERLAVLREKRVQEQLESEFLYVAASKEKLEKIELQEKEEALRIITEAQELVKTFIKREDLQRIIEAAVENPKDYNFSIDSEGREYKGERASLE